MGNAGALCSLDEQAARLLRNQWGRQQMDLVYDNRRHAGRVLAALLRQRQDGPPPIVLALPRGGVPVAYEVALALGAPLDVFLVRKLGVPGHEELAMGAIASGGTRVLNDEVVATLGIGRNIIDAVSHREMLELERREAAYRRGREPVDVAGKHVLLVDDGLATGASMRAAIAGLRALGASRITVAVPVASQETCDDLRDEVDEIVCAATPEPFYAVGSWYRDFPPVRDEEVMRLLDEVAHPSRAP